MKVGFAVIYFISGFLIMLNLVGACTVKSCPGLICDGLGIKAHI